MKYLTDTHVVLVKGIITFCKAIELLSMIKIH